MREATQLDATEDVAEPPPTRRYGLTWLAAAQAGQLVVLGLGDWADLELAPGVFVERALPVLYGAGLLMTALEFAGLARLARLRSVAPWSLSAVLVGLVAWACYLGAWFLHRLVPFTDEVHPAFWVSLAGGMLNTPYVLLVAVALQRARGDLAARTSTLLLVGLVLATTASLATLLARRAALLLPSVELPMGSVLGMLSSAMAYAIPSLLLLLSVQLSWTRGTSAA